MASTISVQDDRGPAPSGPAGAARPKKRDALLDNAKFLLIVLVVVGHAIEPSTESRIAEAIYFWIYLFHMPAFVLISGYLSKSQDGSGRRIDKLLTTIAGPYLIFWGIYALQSLSSGRALPDGPLEPLWLTWFLAALFVWRLSVPLWKRVRWPLAVAIGLSLAGGLVATGDALGISRILSLLPFFVAGLLMEQRHFDFLKSGWVRVWSAGVVLITAAMSYLYLEQLSREWVYWRESLVDRDMDLLPVGLPGRVLFLLLAFALTAALLSLIPRRTTWFTRYGALTMYAFLLHGLVVRIAEQFGWYDWSNSALGDHGAFLLNGALAVGLTLVLMSAPVRRATGWLVEPRLDWMLRRNREEKPSPSLTGQNFP
ncbi:acyltransferase family protein [Nocardiopsis composta]|uniref:Fucose 4-O-acetylase-like acetyltransferase n=1 Tax=Nocardiopsis composta TaxID=157465 RepID=A0A7W8QLP6_9ACTN|nr:acyltransferase family protein [Nocardiopsis composta]MBB5432757.1 fucose 4-O-acetylase-like acetyltransferase [Nocardiopsis composta]